MKDGEAWHAHSIINILFFSMGLKEAKWPNPEYTGSLNTVFLQSEL